MKATRECYTHEFKQEAVRLVESGQSQAAAARSLGVVEQTLRNWIKAHRPGPFRTSCTLRLDPIARFCLPADRRPNNTEYR
jgi:transposase-like protein